MHIKPVESEDEWQAARLVRTRVFIEEQDCPPEEEWDGHDVASRHLIGRRGKEIVAAARWRSIAFDDEIVAKLERFAVLPAHRGEGLGRALVAYTMEDARQAGFSTFLLNAQAHLEAFYASFGFTSTGRRFEEAGIPHVQMILQDE